MTYLIVDDAGKFRLGEEGVFDGDTCIFMAPPPSRVPILMNDLFIFLNNEKDNIHPLILSSIFHYEFVFIHPFSDGNGRLARLWQNIILADFKDIFEYMPIETNIKEYQNEYYKVIDNCNKNGNSNEFIEFMLKMIDETLKEAIENTKNNMNISNVNVSKLLGIMENNVPMKATEIMTKLNIKSKETLRNNYLNPAIELGLIQLTIPDKSTSKNQMYYKI